MTEVRKFSKSTPIEVRLFGRADISDSDACWLFTGAIRRTGYGEICYLGKVHKAHRVAYMLTKGPIPDGMVIDHACHNRDKSCRGGWSCEHRRCINPAHLDAVTPLENRLRSPLTPGGNSACLSRNHPYTDDNTYITPRGKRVCRTCADIARQNYKARKAS